MTALSMINRKGEDCTVQRYAAGSIVNRRYVLGTPETPISFKMSIQPLKGVELAQRPDLDRSKEWSKGYSPIELFGLDEATGKKGDVISCARGNYEVQKVESWTAADCSIAPFWKVLLTRVNVV